jgi:hypothetical protein
MWKLLAIVYVVMVALSVRSVVAQPVASPGRVSGEVLAQHMGGSDYTWSLDGQMISLYHVSLAYGSNWGASVERVDVQPIHGNDNGHNIFAFVNVPAGGGYFVTLDGALQGPNGPGSDPKLFSVGAGQTAIVGMWCRR